MSVKAEALESRGSATGAESPTLTSSTSSTPLGSGDAGDFFLNGFMFGEGDLSHAVKAMVM